MVSLSSNPERQVVQLLRLAQEQARLAQDVAAPRMQDALAELDEVLGDQLGLLAIAAEQDQDDAEESGAAERSRRAYYPLPVI